MLTTASAFFLVCSSFLSICRGTSQSGQPLLLPLPSPSASQAAHAHPPFLSGLGLGHFLDGPRIDFPPAFPVVFHLLLIDRQLSYPVLLFLLHKPVWKLPLVLIECVPRWRDHQIRLSQKPSLPPPTQVDSHDFLAPHRLKELSIRSLVAFLEEAITAPRARPSGSRIRCFTREEGRRSQLSPRHPHLQVVVPPTGCRALTWVLDRHHLKPTVIL